MNALYRHRMQSRGRLRLAYVTLLIAVLVLLDILSGGKMRSVVRVLGAHIWQSARYISVSVATQGFLTTRRSLEAENARLRTEVALYQEKENNFRVMQEENTRLRDITGLASRVPGKAALFISSSSASPYGTFLINTGSADNIRSGSIVFTGDGFALGEVQELTAHTALVREFFAPSRSLEAVVDGVSLTLEGRGGGNARARSPRDNAVNQGSIVYGRQVGTPVGIVGRVVSDPASAYSDVYVVFPTNLQSLQYVYVARK